MVKIMLKNKLKTLRKNEGLTQSGLAEALGVTRASLAKYETGAAVPPADIIVKICDFFGCGADCLLETKAYEKDSLAFLNEHVRVLQRAADKSRLTDKELQDILNYAGYRYPGRLENLDG